MEMNLPQFGPLDPALGQNLRRTKGWIVFVGIMSIIGGSLSVILSLLGMVGTLVGASAAGSFMDEPLSAVPFAGAYVAAAVIFCIVGVATGALSIWAAVMLFQAGSQADFYAAGGSAPALAGFIGRLRTYFLVIGTNAIVLTVGILIFIILAVAGAGQAASGYMP